MLHRRTELLGPAYRVFYDRPVHFVRGAGVWLYDESGQAYLDAYNNVPSVGHCHPDVVGKLCEQAGRLNVHTRYLDATILDYAEKLLATFPSSLNRVMFTCSGSEANDLALRVAHHNTQNSGVIVTQFAYHGTTAAVAAVSPSLGSGLGPHVRTVPPPESAEDFDRQVASAISDLDATGLRPSALLVDTIFSSDGIRSSSNLLQASASRMRAAGGLFIADEVQAGFARTGEHMWGFERHGIVPDVVTLGKAIGNGHPMAAVVCRAELLDDFGKRMRYFNTLAGNPVSAAVGDAVLDVIAGEHLMEHAHDVGEYLNSMLRTLASQRSAIIAVRGVGLVLGVELASGKEAAAVVNALRERRILVGTCGPQANVVKIRPPLVFTKENADYLVSELAGVLA